MKLTGIRLENIRVFEGEHLIPIDPGLTVLVGRNNAGKSTVLRAPFVFLQAAGGHLEVMRRGGSSECQISVEFAARPSDWSRLASIANPLDVMNKSGGGDRLSSRRAFLDWASDPRLEVGFRSAPHAKVRVLILRAHGSRDHIVLRPDGLSFGYFGNDARTRIDCPSELIVLGQKLFTSDKELSPNYFALWEHHRDEKASGMVAQPNRRLQDTDERRALEVLTFLRLKHPTEFERISAALKKAFPEFGGLDFIDASHSGYDYRPGFSRDGTLLARESIGNGAWAYLCILTAARAAKATGAQILFLDEPHLYLHPALERMLIDELLDPKIWDNAPLQIVAATHSPTFVNEAIERGTLNVLEWDDPQRTKVRVEAVRSTEPAGKAFQSLGAAAGDILYAERVIFVEGPSDVAALRALGEARCGLKRNVRFVPLNVPDSIAPEIARFFSVVREAQGLGVHARALMILDGDKKAKLEKEWDKEPDRDPRNSPGLEVIWSDPRGNDLESVFCDEAFLSSYFISLKIQDHVARPVIQKHLRGVAYPAAARSQKGCTAIRAMHAELLAEQDGSGRKADDLENLVAFYLSDADDKVTHAGVKQNLAPIEDALRKLCS